MDHPANRRTLMFVRALLVLLCLFAVPELVSGQPDSTADQAAPSSKNKRPTGRSALPMRVNSRLFPDGDDCAVAKVDIWLQRGNVTYSTFLPGKSPAQISRSNAGGSDGTTILIGEKDCLVRIRIERASDASVYDWDQARRLRDSAEQAQ
jgi:hypothetical protein